MISKNFIDVAMERMLKSNAEQRGSEGLAGRLSFWDRGFFKRKHACLPICVVAPILRRLRLISG
jgi:hypothetical protein